LDSIQTRRAFGLVRFLRQIKDSNLKEESSNNIHPFLVLSIATGTGITNVERLLD
jgi:hypothetical protein